MGLPRPVFIGTGDTVLALLLAFPAGVYSEAKVVLKKTGTSLEVHAPMDGKVDRVELRLHSCRNETISRFTEVSPRNPHPPGKWPVDRETWYPVVDVALEEDMEGVARFEPAPQTPYVINGMFYREKKALSAQVVIGRDRLEPWENSLFVETAAARLVSFHLRKRFPAPSGELRHVFKLLSEDWSGSVSLHAVEAGGAAQATAVLDLQHAGQAGSSCAAVNPAPGARAEPVRQLVRGAGQVAVAGDRLKLLTDGLR